MAENAINSTSIYYKYLKPKTTMSNSKLFHIFTSTSIGAFIFSSVCGAIEPLKSASETVSNNGAIELLATLDTNKDGNIQNTEDLKFWKRNKGFDENKDNQLDLEELKQTFSRSINSPGKKLLNVKYKNTPIGGVYLDIFYPDEDTSNAKPVVFFTHGGGWATGNKSKASSGSFSKVHEAWLKEGFVVVSIGYRLVKKNGTSLMRDCVIDCKDAMRFISGHKASLGIDPNKFYTFGDSAGGHLAMMLLHTPPSTLTGDTDLKQYSYKTVAGVSWYGPCDFQDVQLFNHDDRPKFNDRFGPRISGKKATPEVKTKLYREMSPITALTENSAPLLMIQGDKDTTIPVKQAHRMQEQLKTIKAPVEIMIIKNAGHNWRSVEHPISPTREDIIKKTVKFVLKHKK